LTFNLTEKEQAHLHMTSPSDSPISEPVVTDSRQQIPKWLKVSAIAAGSALAGGLAAAWFYRGTLKTLRHAETDLPNPDFRISTDHSDDDT
jgi:hypothetical protein